MLDDYSPNQKKRIDFFAYHRYLARKRNGLLGENDEERQTMQDEDWRLAEWDFEREEIERMRKLA